MTNDKVWRAPLLSVALAATAGIILDRTWAIPLEVSLTACLGALAGCFIPFLPQSPLRPLLCLWVAVAAFASAYHHWHRDGRAANDISFFATAKPRPILLRGQLASEPVVISPSGDDDLRTSPNEPNTHFQVRAAQVRQGHDWLAVSGRVEVNVPGNLRHLHVGDQVEIVGRLQKPTTPGNPGEFDYAGFLHDEGIHAQVQVKIAAAVQRVQEGWPLSLKGWLAVLRGWGRRVLEEMVPQHKGLATALLLGDGSALFRAEWDIFQRTGVIHVLAISGQHLAVLGGFLWLGLRLLHVPRRRGALGVALFLLAYALLAGGRPPVMRSAVMVLAYCGAMWLRRPVHHANTLALAWLTVALLNPTDLANAGCQLSFLAVAVLGWGTSRWRSQADAVDKLVAQGRPWWLRLGFTWGGVIVWFYLVNAAVWFGVTPLVAARYHLISPVALLIGPPMMLLTSAALLLGFLVLLLAPVSPPLAWGIGWCTDGCLAACEGFTNAGAQVPLGYFFTPEVPGWWLAVFYLGLLWALTQESWRGCWHRWLLAAAAWAGCGLLAWFWPLRPAELRCTFLAVGHGGCTVLETPDGKTLLYDAGAMGGPEVSRRHIAPYLWQRGLWRIDEVFLSHADLDHFNGLPALLERFTIGQVTCTPTFAERPSRGVAKVLKVLHKRGIRLRVIKAGDQLAYGDVHFQVLHPPLQGPQGNENSRSLVMLVQHGQHSLLLSGDLEGEGLAQVLTQPPQQVDVLMAPHHGSRTANTPALASWARPKAVVSSQGPPKRSGTIAEVYETAGARFFATWLDGAVTVRSDQAGLVLETYRSQRHWMIR